MREAPTRPTSRPPLIGSRLVTVIAWFSGISPPGGSPYGRTIRIDDQGVTMRSKNRSATIAVGIGLALAAATPVAQAKAPSVDRPATSFYTARTLNALDQRWNAEAASFAPGRALKALDARWNAEARSFGRR
jgi:hypothetical protein